MNINFVKRIYDRFEAAGNRGRFQAGLNPTRLFGQRNARYNARFSKVSTYIGNQSGGGAADDLRFGLFRMATNGCEVIATYNLLKYLGKQKDIRKIATDYETRGAIALGGFGVRPSAIRSYLSEELGEEVTLVRDREAFRYDDHMGNHRTAILTFWNGPKKWTIHTVMLCRLKTGRIRVFNLYSNKLFADFASIETMLSHRAVPFVPICMITPEGPENRC